MKTLKSIHDNFVTDKFNLKEGQDSIWIEAIKNLSRTFSSQVKANYVLRVQDHKSPILMRKKFRMKRDMKKTALTSRTTQISHANFHKTDFCDTVRYLPMANYGDVSVQGFVEPPSWLLRTGSMSMEVAHTAVQQALIVSRMRLTCSKFIQQLIPSI